MLRDTLIESMMDQEQASDADIQSSEETPSASINVADPNRSMIQQYPTDEEPDQSSFITINRKKAHLQEQFDIEIKEINK